ncbi:MAG: DivIVA domain-containing protein [Bacteroidetes bacterium]|nr:DivIVA domain-containing protein [Rhodothermia bacterium]MCS7154678.1 DivIVA domain-containing protein [Bacteroidota bacterium]MCX7906395.1 DivIVA domain-containing protein [Bacteroidota bacterium]MDW8137471.1 DivIVA domain-containing protein [Bacteroidota bacterium]MDW8285575.1 DivIVA domain-containing protein [Bacteroidota bacterium]
MRLTAGDIRKQRFARRVRGYDPGEVEAFLGALATYWEQREEELENLRRQVRELQERLEHYQKVEEALQQTLATSREMAREALSNAERRAQVLLEQAELKARQLLLRVHEERTRLQTQLARLIAQRQEILARIRSLLESELRLLERFEAEASGDVPELERASQQEMKTELAAMASAPAFPEPSAEPSPSDAPAALQKLEPRSAVASEEEIRQIRRILDQLE